MKSNSQTTIDDNDHGHASDGAGPASQKIPGPVRIALGVLNELEPSRAKRLQKPLTAYAMTLARQGTEVTPRILHDALAKGDDAILGPRTAFNKMARPLETIEQRYKRITKDMPIPTSKGPDASGLAPHERLILAVYYRDVDAVGAQIHHVKSEEQREAALSLSIVKGLPEITKILFEAGFSSACKDPSEPLRLAIAGQQWMIVDYLLNMNVDTSNITLHEYQSAAIGLISVQKWLQSGRRHPPPGLESFKPESLPESKIDDILKISSLMESEDEPPSFANTIAYFALKIFGTPDKVMDYFEKWAPTHKKPLTELFHNITPPQNKNYDKDAWIDAMITCGPSMAKLLSGAHLIGRPAKTIDGNGWSAAATRAEIAKKKYKNGWQNEKLRDLLCHYQISERGFNTALRRLRAYRRKTKKRIPDVTINGKAFGLPRATFKKLQDGDYRGFILGEITNCCQSVGNSGSTCALHGFSSEDGGFYIVAVNDNKKREEIIGQSWAWRGKKGELVLDSLETLGTRITPEQWTKLLNKFALAVKKTDVTALNVGTGGGTPTLPFDVSQAPASLANYRGYLDSKEQYSVWQKKSKPAPSKKKIP